MPTSQRKGTKTAGAEEATIAAVREVYAELANRPVERNCIGRTECCRFKLTGETPWLSPAEALLAARAWRASGRTKLPEPPGGECPMLDLRTGRCGIYEDRPFGCRTHFCQAAGGPYARRDVIDLIRRLEDVSGALGENEPLPLQSAMKRWVQ
jgi:uncharacterized protein